MTKAEAVRRALFTLKQLGSTCELLGTLEQAAKRLDLCEAQDRHAMKQQAEAMQGAWNYLADPWGLQNAYAAPCKSDPPPQSDGA